MRTVSFTTSFNPSLYFVFVLVALILLFPHLLAASRKPAPVDNRSAQTSAILHRPHPASVSTTPASAILTAAVSWATTSSATEEGTTQAGSPDPDSGLAEGTAESTLGSSAGGMAADTATTPGANTKTAASEKVASSASTVEKAAADGQDTDAVDEKQGIPNTVKAQIRAALDLLVSQAKSSEGCPGQIEITDDISILKSVNSDILFQAIADCDGQTLFSLLPVITVLGTVILKDDPFALSGLGVAMLIRFFSEHTERHIVRRGLAMFYAMLPKTNRNVELFSWLLGIAKKRLYTANQEMRDNGFFLDDAHTNHPGAGRTSASQSFESEILPQCIAAGLEESEIILRQQERKAKEAAATLSGMKEDGNDSKEKGSTADTPGGETTNTTDGETTNTAERQDSAPGQAAPEGTSTSPDSYTSAANSAPTLFRKSTATYEEVLDSFESSRPHTEKAIARLDAMLCSMPFGDMAYLYGIRCFIMSSVQFVADELERLKPRSNSVPSNTDETPNSIEVSQQITDAFRPTLLFRIDLQIKATVQMCVKLLSAMDELDQGLPVYRQINALKKAFKVKPYMKYIRWCQNEYRSGVGRIAFLARTNQRIFDALRKSDDKDGEYGESATESEFAVESESSTGTKFLEPLPSACISVELTMRHSEEVLQDLEEVCQSLNPLTCHGVGAPQSQEAYGFLLQLAETFRTALQLNLPEDATAARAARASLVEIVRIALRDIRQRKGTPYEASERINRGLLRSGFRNRVAKAIEDIRIFTPGNSDGNEGAEKMAGNAVKSPTAAPECSSAEQNTHPGGTVKPDEIKIPEEQRTSVKQHADEVQATLEALVDHLEGFLGMKSGKRGKRSKEELEHRQAIKDALDSLTGFRERFSAAMDSVWNSHTYTVWNAAVSLVRVLNEIGSRWLGKWKKAKSYKTAFNMVQRIAESILSDKNQNRINLRFTQLDQALQAVTAAEDTLSNYIECSNSDDMADWFSQTASLAPDKRAGLIRKLWDEGKDPTDIKVWIDYILGKEYARNYGDPSEQHHCCKITRSELKNAFCYLSGIEKSDTTLWNIVTKQMGYSNRQCAKLDQIGGSHPLRKTQYDFIQSQIEAAELGKTLVLSVDTKAFIVLGRLKHDNGRLLCSQGKGVYRVFDHDYPFVMTDIYPNGCSFVDSSRMNEKAILRPVGAYCPQDGTGYVGLVLGKDTAESMANLIQKVIEVKRSTTMPNLETVLIVADGGGANMSNGIQWKNQLLDLSAKTNMAIQVCHLAPGSSRHNPIEHRLWSEVSIHWKGKPLLDIEHVMRYINETTTGGSTLNHVTCWFDSRRYKTNQEKKENGEDVLTRDELDEKAKGRISYLYEEGTDMHKWNYVISPAAKIEAAVA